MTLFNKVLVLLQDNKERSSREIYKELVINKEHFFMSQNPVLEVSKVCNKLIKQDKLRCFDDKPIKYYVSYYESKDINEKDIKPKEIEEFLEPVDIVESITKYENKKNQIAHDIYKRRVIKNSLTIGILVFGIYIATTMSASILTVSFS